MTSSVPALLAFDEAKETHAVWTVEQENYFINLLSEKVQAKGENRQTGTFAKKEWLDMRVKFYKCFGKKYSLKQFKNKYNQLKVRHKAFKKLLEGVTTTGLGWDPVLKTVTASDEWWFKYLKTNPDASRFRKKGCPEYDDLGKVFGDKVATGSLQASTNNDSDSTDREDNESEEFVEGNPCTPLEATSFPSIRADGEDEEMQGPSRPRPHTPSNIRRGKKESKTFELNDALHRTTDVGQTREECKTKHTRSEHINVLERKKKHTISECMDLLDAISSQIPDDVYMRALKLLQERGWREAFLRMSDDRRKGWLQSIASRDI